MSYSLTLTGCLVAITLRISAAASAKVPFRHVMIFILEKTNYSNAMNQPFLSELSKKGASLDNMTALTHPSQGNYISMIGGDTFEISNDKNIDLEAQHIGDFFYGRKSKTDYLDI